VTGNDLTWPHVTERVSEVMSFARKSRGSGCRRPIRQVLGTFEFLQDCNSHEVAITCQEMTSRDPTWPEVTLFDWQSPGSSCSRSRSQVLGTFELLQGCNSQVAVTWPEMTSRDPTWPEVTRKWRHLTGSHLEVAVEGL